jgi:D-lyxose ketol-isomerase
MLRSKINSLIEEAKEFFNEMRWNLPPFAYYELEDWTKIIEDSELKLKYLEIFTKGLGWDVTDFGMGNFYDKGLLLFTTRNGDENGLRNYAEKIMIVRENQVTDFHYHWSKVEDIINRGGGNLVVELYHASNEDDPPPQPSENCEQGIFDNNKEVRVYQDGIWNVIEPGGRIILTPGESITFPPRLYHKFYGEPNKGTVLVGEISRVNDDNLDNRFCAKLPRYSGIVNDELPKHLLCNEYNNIEEIKEKVSKNRC